MNNAFHRPFVDLGISIDHTDITFHAVLQMYAAFSMLITVLLLDLWRLQHVHHAEVMGRELGSQNNRAEAFRAVEAWAHEVEAGTEGSGEAFRAALHALETII